MSTKQKIFQAFENGTLACKNISEICKTLDIPYREKNRLLGVLEELIKEGKIYENDGGRYGTSEQLGLIAGEIVGNERGFAFLVPDNKIEHTNDFFIPKKYLHGALHGDRVLAQKLSDSFGEREEAAVIKILSRGYEKIVGTFRRDRRAGYLIPDEKKFSTDIYIPLSSCERIKNGVKAVAKITSYPFGRAPGGEIIEVLGDEDDFFAEELSIIRSYDLKEEFPPHVEKEAKNQQAKGIAPQDIERRRDFRNKLIVTIDGADTRDIDDRAESTHVLLDLGRKHRGYAVCHLSRRKGHCLHFLPAVEDHVGIAEGGFASQIFYLRVDGQVVLADVARKSSLSNFHDVCVNEICQTVHYDVVVLLVLCCIFECINELFKITCRLNRQIRAVKISQHKG